ncbi:MAG: 2-oxo acid dehydrogenase subunit E2, partial [Micrococcales bacterium]|nr:2-oxo acid dehydrogenase subunit E2 [Micrococcales bacterium]
RRLAAEAGLALEDIPGSGPRGRVLRLDVDAAVAARAASPEPDPATSPSVAASPEYEEVPHTRVRLVTARRLTESVREAPHFSLRASVRADRLLALRAELADDAATRVSLTDLVVRAVALAHARVPDMNVTWTDTAVRRYARADIGIAVDTEHGLLVPVLRDAGALGVAGLAARVRDLAERARGRRLRPEELEGGSITVTNLGMFGVEEFSAVINPPHAAILAVGAVREEPVVVDGALAVGRVLRLTLTVDHRPVDGALAARWLAVLVELLEHPARLLV